MSERERVDLARRCSEEAKGSLGELLGPYSQGCNKEGWVVAGAADPRSGSKGAAKGPVAVASGGCLGRMGPRRTVGSLSRPENGP